MKVAVYSGSFNPLHKGHEAILRHLTRDGRYGRVLLVVTPQNPFKDKADDAPQRLQAAKQAILRHSDIKADVSDIELRMPPPQYTIRTLDALKKENPGDDFTLVVGADCLAGFKGWKEFSRILTEYGLVVFPRKGYHRGRLKAQLLRESPDYRIELLKAPLVTVSSTFIREGLQEGKDMTKWLM